jgi:hypothetical protein
MSSSPSPGYNRPLVLAILIITVGVGWLMTAKGVGPGINWIWTLSLGVAGVLTFVINGGVDKLSVVIGPCFLAASVMSILRQTGHLSTDEEIPLFVILIGVLLLIAQFKSIPLPRWYEPPGRM